MTAVQDLKKKYTARRRDNLVGMAEKLQTHLADNLKGNVRVDQIRVRAKDVDRFCKKAAKKEGARRKYNDPLNQIQDQLGARIVVRYLEDVPEVSKIIEKHYRSIETQSIVPDSVREFGYEGKHYILLIPDAVRPSMNGGDFPKFFELQIRTLFQHAWSETEHDLGYKPSQTLTTEETRKMSFTAAQAWGADKISQELLEHFSPKKKPKK